MKSLLNFKDMCLLKQENIHEDRLVYIRRKTKRVYNLKLTKKAKEIISYYVNRLQTFPNVNQYIFPILPSHFGTNCSAFFIIIYIIIDFRLGNS